MAIREEKLSESCWVLWVDGRLDQSQTGELEASLNRLLEEDQNNLIVDLSQTTYINSGGLRSLVTAWRVANQQGGDLLLSGLNARLEEIFSMVGFDQVFKIFPTSVEAQKAF